MAVLSKNVSYMNCRFSFILVLTASLCCWSWIWGPIFTKSSAGPSLLVVTADQLHLFATGFPPGIDDIDQTGAQNVQHIHDPTLVQIVLDNARFDPGFRAFLCCIQVMMR